MTRTLYHTEIRCFICHTKMGILVSEIEDMAGIMIKNQIAPLCNEWQKARMVSKDELMSV